MTDVTTKYTTLRAHLDNQKTETGDLYTHLTKVMSHLVNHVPADEALNQLEEVSYLHKKGSTHVE